MTTASTKTGMSKTKLRLLSRLANDWRGVSMPMMAIGVIPLLGFVGGSVDIGRSYLVKARLQQACDAGALASRRAMTGTSLSAANEAEGDKFFDFNFPEGTMATYDIDADYANGTTAGTVSGTASATLDNSVMRIFGKDSATINVTCSSILTVPNTDVMFVLDISGSMTNNSGDGTTRIDGLKAATKDFFRELGPGTGSGAGRIRYGVVPYNSNTNVGFILRTANPVWLAGGTPGENWNYQTRTANTRLAYIATPVGSESAHAYGTATYSATFTYPTSWTSYGTSGTTSIAGSSYTNRFTGVTNASCTTSSTALPDGPAANTIETNTGTTGTPSYVSSVNPTYPATFPRTNTYNTAQNVLRRQYRYLWTLTSGTVGTCQLQNKLNDNSTTVVRNTPSTRTQSVSWEARTYLTGWTMQQAAVDVSTIVPTGTGPNPTYWSGAYSDIPSPNSYTTPSSIDSTPSTMILPSTVTWTGCVEEASTVSTIAPGASMTIPAGALDMSINHVPNAASTIAQKWKPHLGQLQFGRNDSNVWHADPYWTDTVGVSVCGTEGRKLAKYTTDIDATGLSTSFGAYINTLTAKGGTQHDIGMIWGARMLSPTGIFASENADSTGPGGFPINRHLVFMTDGTMDSKKRTYNAWGITGLDFRQAPNTVQDVRDSPASEQLNNIHYQRMEMICTAARSQGFTVWVIGFGITTMPASLQRCASDADHAFVVTTSASLRSRFTAIAETIGGLRLSS